jgi:hypothetical protein
MAPKKSKKSKKSKLSKVKDAVKSVTKGKDKSAAKVEDKSDAKVEDKPASETFKSENSIQSYVSNNLKLILPIFTYVVFNFFKENFFEGYAINFIELFYMIITTTVVFSLTLKNTCDQTFDPTANSLQQPLANALALLFFVYLFNIFNPCRQYMTYSQSNLFFLLLIVFGFNLINYLTSKNKDNYCKNNDNKLLIFFLLILNVGLIYASKF